MYQEQVEAESQNHQSSLEMKQKPIVILVKFYPIIANLWIFLAMVGTIFGIDISIYTYTFLGQSFITNAMILILSYLLNFCGWHRMLIYSMSACLFLETLNNYGIQNNYYIYHILIISLLGLILSTVIFYKRGRIQQKFGKHI